jgi:Ca-activated chloride channel homolog
MRIPVFSAALLLFTAEAFADTDRAGSPYFQVVSDQPGTDRLPLEETSAKVDIAGVIAKVEVTQVYQNEGSRPIEAIYVFPGSTRSAVFGMEMTIGERRIVAKIEKRDQARAMYERAKSEGKSASLLEQHRPNVFQMNVANIMPGDRIVVKLSYTELLVPEEGVYEFVYPTVVGPRYANGASGTDERWTQNPYLGEGEKAPYKWDLSARIDAGMAVEAVNSPSHQVSPRFTGTNKVAVEVDDETGGNRDFVLRYRLAGKTIQSGLLTFEGKDENFFLMMMQPPQRPAANAIPPREYIFVVDISGSMHGYPLDTSKAVMRKLLGGLKSQDRFNVMLFAGNNSVMAERSIKASKGNIDKALALIDRQQGSGSTEMIPAMERALAMPRDPEMSTSIVLITDGYVAVERKLFDLIRKNLDKANVFAFGIGTSVNRALIEGVARSGMGEPFVVIDSKGAAEAGEKFAKYIESPVLTNVGVHFDGFEAYDVEPAAIPDLFSERPIIVFGKYRGRAQGRIAVEGKNSLGSFSHALAVADSASSENNAALRWLWARHRIANLADVGQLDRDPSIAKEITELGLKYSLMTEHTSFIAIDSEKRNHEGTSVTVEQPLPLPQGVSNHAVGRSSAMPFTLRAPAAKPSRPSLQKSYDAPAEELDEDGRFEGGESIAPAPVVEAEKPPEPAKTKKSLSISGAPENVRRMLLARTDSFGRCTNSAFSLHAKIEIGKNGRIKSIEIVRSSGNRGTDACVLRMLKTLRFPAEERFELTLSLN